MTSTLAAWQTGGWQRALEPLPDRQQVVALVLAGAILLLVVELLRRRKLREEYAWVWLVTALLLTALAIWQDVLVVLSRVIGAAAATSTLFFGAILFLLLLALQFSVRLSKLTHRHKTLAQRLALLENQVKRLRGETPAAGGEVLPLRDARSKPGARGAREAERQDGVG